jgi:multiple sugar transport system ATP-binding protein
MASVAFQSVTKTFDGGVDAVADLDLTVEDGELLVLVGPSGCGKSTALRMIAGLETPTKGEVFIGEECVTEMAPRERDVAMVFQNYALYPHMTVERNLGFGLRIQRMPKALIAERVAAAAHMLELTEHLHKRPAQLSGGQRQRVAMGRAIVREPEVFLMDEPLSNLDAKLRGTMRAEIVALQRELRTTLVHVTHDQTEAMTMGQRVAILRRGVLQQVAPPEELFDAPRNVFVAGFIGTPAMNLYRGHVTTGDDGARQLALGSTTMSYSPAEQRDTALGRCPDGPVVVGVRPHDVELGSGGEARAVTKLVESLGSELLVHAGFDAPLFSAEPDAATADDDVTTRRLDAQLVIRLDVSARRPRVGEAIHPRFPAAALHLFDAGDETRLA